MRTSGILMATTLAVGMAGAPATVNALDLGGTVSRTTESLSKTTRSVTDSLSKTTRSVTRSVGSTTKSVTDGVTSTTKSVTDGLSSTTNSLTGTSVNVGTEDGGASLSVESGDTTATVGVLSNYQLVSLGLESNPSPAPGQGGGEQFTEVNREYVNALVAGLGRLERQELEIKCADVLRTPQAFDGELILLCEILASI